MIEISFRMSADASSSSSDEDDYDYCVNILISLPEISADVNIRRRSLSGCVEGGFVIVPSVINSTELRGSATVAGGFSIEDFPPKKRKTSNAIIKCLCEIDWFVIMIASKPVCD